MRLLREERGKDGVKADAAGRRERNRSCVGLDWGLGKLCVPRAVAHDDDGFLLVLELVGCDVENDAIHLQPRMGLIPALAAYVFRAAVTVLFKVFCKEQRGDPAGPMRESLEDRRKLLRITLLKRPSEPDGEIAQVAYVSFDREWRSFFIHKSPPMAGRPWEEAA